MKRIAIITSSFSGATLPLAKQFLKDGYAVDYYLISGNSVELSEGVDFDVFQANRFLAEIDKERCQSLIEYFNSSCFHLYYHKRPRPYKKVPVLRRIIAFYLSFYDRRFCKRINTQDYVLVNLVGTFRSDYYGNYIKYIRSHVVVSLHEVIPNLLNKNAIITPPWFKRLFLSDSQIVVHSRNTFNDINMFKELPINKLHLIRFGLFETYKTIIPDEKITQGLPDSYVLFFGTILPYKGLDLLYKAVVDNRELYGSTKFVVAGSGYVECLDEIKKDKAFICINRRMSNGELSALIQKSLFVVCPYRGISQSGIPQTAFVFNKPIVASCLNAFKEVMKDGLNCLFFESENSNDLAKKMKEMIDTYEFYVDNVKRFERDYPEYSWPYIAQQYVELLND